MGLKKNVAKNNNKFVGKVHWWMTPTQPQRMHTNIRGKVDGKFTLFEATFWCFCKTDHYWGRFFLGDPILFPRKRVTFGAKGGWLVFITWIYHHPTGRMLGVAVGWLGFPDPKICDKILVVTVTVTRHRNLGPIRGVDDRTYNHYRPEIQHERKYRPFFPWASLSEVLFSPNFQDSFLLHSGKPTWLARNGPCPRSFAPDCFFIWCRS